jgi:hypothetical protein
MSDSFCEPTERKGKKTEFWKIEKMRDLTSSTENSQVDPSTLADLTSRISQMLSQTTTAATHESIAAPIGIKLKIRTMDSGPKLSRCISLVKTSWDT